MLTLTLTLWLAPPCAVAMTFQPNGNWSFPLNSTSFAMASSTGSAPTEVLILLRRMMGILYPRGRKW